MWTVLCRWSIASCIIKNQIYKSMKKTERRRRREQVKEFLALGKTGDEGIGHNYAPISPYDYCARMFHGHPIHRIENRPVYIDSVHGRCASGGIVYRGNPRRAVPIKIVYVSGAYGFGTTVRDAWLDARDRAWRRMPLEERIVKVKEKYPRLESRATWGELCAVHTMITGSCERGKVKWLLERGYNLRDKVTMGRFLRETEGDYGNGNIKKLKEAYGRECKGGEKTAG